MKVLACIFPGCPGHNGERLDEILHSINALAQAVGFEFKKENTFMGTVEEGLTEVEAGVASEEAELAVVETDETRELADLTALKASQNGELSDADQARFDALTASLATDEQKLAADDAAINAADPAPVADPAAPAAS